MKKLLIVLLLLPSVSMAEWMEESYNGYLKTFIDWSTVSVKNSKNEVLFLMGLSVQPQSGPMPDHTLTDLSGDHTASSFAIQYKIKCPTVSNPIFFYNQEWAKGYWGWNWGGIKEDIPSKSAVTVFTTVNMQTDPMYRIAVKMCNYR